MPNSNHIVFPDEIFSRCNSILLSVSSWLRDEIDYGKTGCIGIPDCRLICEFIKDCFANGSTYYDVKIETFIKSHQPHIKISASSYYDKILSDEYSQVVIRIYPDKFEISEQSSTEAFLVAIAQIVSNWEDIKEKIISAVSECNLSNRKMLNENWQQLKEQIYTHEHF